MGVRIGLQRMWVNGEVLRCSAFCLKQSTLNSTIVSYRIVAVGCFPVHSRTDYINYHSLTSRPSSMTVGDSRWPLYCLFSPLFPILWHLLQLNVATTTPLFYVVHHFLLGLPWWRKPSTLPSKTVSAKFPALPLVTCPKYCSFIRANFPINYLSRPISSNIDILVRCSFENIPSIFLQHHISKDSILFLSDFFNVHPSTPYWNTAQTIDYITL